MWKMPVARAPAFLLRRILSCAIAVAVLLSASVQDVHGQGWGLDYVWQLLGYDPPAGNGRWQTVGEQDFDRRVLKGTLPALVYFDAANGCDGADGVFTSLSARRKGSSPSSASISPRTRTWHAPTTSRTTSFSCSSRTDVRSSARRRPRCSSASSPRTAVSTRTSGFSRRWKHSWTRNSCPNGVWCADTVSGGRAPRRAAAAATSSKPCRRPSPSATRPACH